MLPNILGVNKKMLKLTFQEIRNILELRYIVLPESAIFYKQREDTIVFLTSVLWVQFCELPKYRAPGMDLLLRVLYPRNRLVTIPTNREKMHLYEKTLLHPRFF